MERIRQALQQIDNLVSRIPLDFTLHFIISALIAGGATCVAGIICGYLHQGFVLGLPS